MKFYLKKVRLLEKRAFTSKAGKDLVFLRIANPETFECDDYMPVQGFDLSKVEEGNEYSAILNVQGRYANIELIPLVGDK